MKILLIEDDPQKAEKVRLVLKGIGPTVTVDIRSSYQSGLKHLKSEADTDLVVLDMSLPTLDPSPTVRNGRPRPLGGYDLMRKLRRARKNISVIVLTAFENFGSQNEQFSFEQLKIKCKTEFPDIFVDAIYYSQSGSLWQTRLLEAIEDYL